MSTNIFVTLCADTPIKKPSFDPRTTLKKEVGTYKDRDDYILQSIEYYFSDENLSKNAYLLKQVSLYARKIKSKVVYLVHMFHFKVLFKTGSF